MRLNESSPMIFTARGVSSFFKFHIHSLKWPGRDWSRLSPLIYIYIYIYNQVWLYDKNTITLYNLIWGQRSKEDVRLCSTQWTSMLEPEKNSRSVSVHHFLIGMEYFAYNCLFGAIVSCFHTTFFLLVIICYLVVSKFSVVLQSFTFVNL